MIEKPQKVRNKAHLKFIRSLPCLYSGGSPTEACHIRLGSHTGMGQKPGDDLTVPYTHEVHMRQHQGEKTFYRNEEGLLKARELAGLLYHYTGDFQTCLGLLIHYRGKIWPRDLS